MFMHDYGCLERRIIALKYFQLHNCPITTAQLKKLQPLLGVKIFIPYNAHIQFSDFFIINKFREKQE